MLRIVEASLWVADDNEEGHSVKMKQRRLSGVGAALFLSGCCPTATAERVGNNCWVLRSYQCEMGALDGSPMEYLGNWWW